MAFLVIADPPEQYEAWAAAERRPAREPSEAEQRRGRDLFVNGRCGMCHAVQGTSAAARYGPDLTHFASRQTLAAGMLPNTVGHLAGWILDPQSIKPGANMPANPMHPAELHALLAYLGTLK
jgi:cytochrome c oxidase subunit 2